MADKSLQRAAETLLAYLSANAGNNPAYHDAAIYIRSLQAERDRLKAELERVRKDAERYQYVRRLDPNRFGELWQRNIQTSEPFDGLVDAAMGKGGRADG